MSESTITLRVMAIQSTIKQGTKHTVFHCIINALVHNTQPLVKNEPPQFTSPRICPRALFFPSIRTALIDMDEPITRIWDMNTTQVNHRAT